MSIASALLGAIVSSPFAGSPCLSADGVGAGVDGRAMVMQDDHVKYPKDKPRHYNDAEAKAHFSTLVRKALRGEEVVIARDHTPLVKLVPVGVRSRTPGSAKGRIQIAADFDAPLAGFADYSQ